jgi:hypothetical protein
MNAWGRLASARQRLFRKGLGKEAKLCHMEMEKRVGPEGRKLFERFLRQFNELQAVETSLRCPHQALC